MSDYLNIPVKWNYKILQYTGHMSFLSLQAYSNTGHHIFGKCCLLNQSHHSHKLRQTAQKHNLLVLIKLHQSAWFANVQIVLVCALVLLPINFFNIPISRLHVGRQWSTCVTWVNSTTHRHCIIEIINCLVLNLVEHLVKPDGTPAYGGTRALVW